MSVQQLHARIDAFLAGDPALTAATGSFCTPFRGSLFGTSSAAEVEARLARREPVFALWLGSNPNVPESLDTLLGECSIDHHWGWRLQVASDSWSERCWARDGGSIAGWDPICRAQRGWQVYSRAFELLGLSSQVAMANYLPWGSGTFDDLLRRLRERQPARLDGMLGFARELNRAVLAWLEPRIVIVPYSLARVAANWPALRHGTLGRGVEVRRVSLPLGGRCMHLQLAECETAVGTRRVLRVPHPSALRLGADQRARVADALAELITSGA